jgi:CRP-like cAMP-binding protein
LQHLLQTLEARDVVTDEETALLATLSLREQCFRRGQEIVRAKSHPLESCLMLEGISGREVMTVDGKRQISAPHIPGDFVDLHSLTLKRMDHGVVSLTDTTVVLCRIPTSEE